MLAIFKIVQGISSTIMSSAGFGNSTSTVIPQEIISAIESCRIFREYSTMGNYDYWWTIYNCTFFVMIMSVYGRFFKLYLYTAIAPIPLSAMAGEPSQSVAKSFIKSYTSVCMEGAIIVLSCIIFSLFASTPPAVDMNAPVATQVWSYIES